MHWDIDAQEVLKRIPASYRKIIQGETEARAVEKNRATVSVSDLYRAHDELFKFWSEGAQHVVNFALLEDESVKADRTSPPVEVGAGKGTIANSCAVLQVCGAPFGCPRRILNPGGLMKRLAARIEASGLKDFLESNVKGPILPHHKFRVSLSGCPNACSQPQICDLGVIAGMVPQMTSEPCSGCMQCVNTCNESALEYLDGGPVVDSIHCIGCGDCTRACPTGALSAERSGYSIVIGGKLGRHPQLGIRMVSFASEDDVEIALDICLDIYMKHSRRGQRFSSIFNQLGADSVCGMIEQRIKDPTLKL